jgi:hypothetical protein
MTFEECVFFVCGSTMEVCATQALPAVELNQKKKKRRNRKKKKKGAPTGDATTALLQQKTVGSERSKAGDNVLGSNNYFATIEASFPVKIQVQIQVVMTQN